MARRAHSLLGIVAALGLAGCGGHSQGASHQQATASNPPGCTDTWTGNAGDSNYTNPANWSTNSVPGMSDAACVPPGSYAVVGSAPQQPANSLLIEGTLCLKISPGPLARSIFNGISHGEKPLPELANPSNAACPAGTMLSFQGTPSLNLGGGSSTTGNPGSPPPAPAPRRPSPTRPRVTIVPIA
jgi:hypothetical protein